jgi:hypothetical protein
MYAETSKNEDTWCEMLGDFRSRIQFNPESIRRVVAQKAFHAFRSEPQWQPQRSVPDRERRQGDCQLELARQQLEFQ